MSEFRKRAYKPTKARLKATLKARLEEIDGLSSVKNLRYGDGSIPGVDKLLEIAEEKLVSVDWLVGREGARREFAGAAQLADLGEALRRFLCDRIVGAGREARLVEAFVPAGDVLLRRLLEDTTQLVDGAAAFSRLKLARIVRARRDSTIDVDRLARILEEAREARPLNVTLDPASSSWAPDWFRDGVAERPTAAAIPSSWAPDWFRDAVAERQRAEATPSEQESLRAAAKVRAKRRRQKAAAKGRKTKGQR